MKQNWLGNMLVVIMLAILVGHVVGSAGHAFFFPETTTVIPQVNAQVETSPAYGVGTGLQAKIFSFSNRWMISDSDQNTLNQFLKTQDVRFVTQSSMERLTIITVFYRDAK